jgi:hypothetical protein
MEIVLAILLAAAIVVGAWGWVARGDALARERRLREEIAGMKRGFAAPAVSVSSPGMTPLMPEPAVADAFFPRAGGEAKLPPAPLVSPLLPAERPGAALPGGLLGAADRHRDSLEKIEEMLSHGMEPGAGPAPSTPPTLSAATTSGPSGDALTRSLSEAAAALERFLDESSRARLDIQAVAASAGRVLESLRASLPLAREAEHETGALAPLVASLAGLADRLNLVSLDATLGPAGGSDAGAASPAPGKSGAEILPLSDEARSLARALATRLRKAAEAAHRAGEGFSSVCRGAQGTCERAARSAERGEALAAVGTALALAFESVRTAAEAARGDRERLARLAAGLEKRLAAEVAASGQGSRAADLMAERQERVMAALREERRAADHLADELKALAAR